MVDSKENYKFDLGVKGLTLKLVILKLSCDSRSLKIIFIFVIIKQTTTLIVCVICCKAGNRNKLFT